MFKFLKKGESINLNEMAPNVNRLGIELGWNTVNTFNRVNVNASIICINKDNSIEEMIYSKHKAGFSEAIIYNCNISVRSIVQFDIDLTKIPSNVACMAISINVHNRLLGFKDLDKAFVSIYDKDKKQEIVRYNISGNFKGDTDILVGNIYQSYNNTWEFKTSGKGVENTNIYELTRCVCKNM